MKMFAMMIAAVLTLGMGTGDAEAKRLGGAKSSGMQRQMDAPKPATPPAAAPAPAATPGAAAAPATAQAAAKPRPSWMGPVAGLAAGLGLAALASHFGFGEELASMMMIGLLVMAVVVVVGMIMRKRAMAQQPAMASAGGMRYQAQEPASRGYEVAMPASGGSAGNASSSNANIPADFDVAGFVRNAKVQFIRLQAANDTGNLDDIREFTTPEMFAQIKMDLSERGGSTQETDVVSVEADVVDVIEEASRYIVSVRFTGQIREEANGAVVPFDEVWHLVKPRSGTGGWLLAGIQQLQ